MINHKSLRQLHHIEKRHTDVIQKHFQMIYIWDVFETFITLNNLKIGHDRKIQTQK